MKRTGMGKGLGKGYKNIAPMDSHIHSLSAKGVSQKYATIVHYKNSKGEKIFSGREKETLFQSSKSKLQKNLPNILEQPNVKYVEVGKINARGNVPKGWSKTLEGKNESWYEYKSNSSYNGNLRLVIKKRNNIKPKYNVQIWVDGLYAGQGKFFDNKTEALDYAINYMKQQEVKR